MRHKGSRHVRLAKRLILHILSTHSDALAAFVGKPRESRPQVVKRIWDHVKSNNLQDPQDRRQIMCDEQLRAVFGVDKMHMFTMNKLLSR